jgi:PKD repeat protein
MITIIAGMLIASTPAGAVQTPQDRLVSDDPANFTPHVLDGDVLAVAVLGNTVVLGGEFTQAQNAGGGTTYSRTNIVAFDRTTGIISTTFAPVLDGKVRTLAPGPDATSVYVGGEFANVNGQIASKITLLDLATGVKRSTFKPGLLNALVYDIKLVGNRLFVGGQFTKVNGQDRSLHAELDPVTGALRPTGAVAFAGTHRGGATFVYKFDVNPAGTQLTAIGNFRTVNGQTRLQVATFDVTGPITLMNDWKTTQFEPNCYSSFQYWVRDIDYSPDGTYFVISTTGGYGSGPPTLCDSISRWSASDRGQSVMPAWVDYSGGDSTYAVAITGSVIYAGGHTRWFNNPFSADNDGPGAVAREGIEALDPVNGLPLSWDPGRNRGRGVFDIIPTDDGLWVGTDTDRIGHGEYHGRVAFFPLAGGKAVPQPTPATLPVDVYLANQPSPPSQKIAYRVNAAGAEVPSLDGGPNWSADTDASPSPYHVSGSSTAGYSAVPRVDASVPANIPRALFDTERWDPSGGNEMQWNFPVTSGHHVTVHLFFANRCTCTDQWFERIFDVRIDNSLVMNDYDIVRDVGHDTGTMKTFNITSDGNIDIDFAHVRENPLINGIEIIDNDAPPDQPMPPLAVRTAFDGTASAPTVEATPGAITWSTVRGAFWLDGTLYRANSDGTFTTQSYDGKTFGAPTALNLYGLTQFSTEMTQMTGLFYSKGSIYFTLSGDNNLYRRYFSVESGIVGAQRFTMPNGGISWSGAKGMFFAGDSLFWAASSTGDLHRLTWSDNGPVGGTDAVVSGPSRDGLSWKAGALFSLPGTMPNQGPSASIGYGCAGTACGFDGTGSHDPDGSIVSYAWDFGDGSQSTLATPAHTFAGPGTYDVTLVVTDDDGATASAEESVLVEEAIQVEYVGSSRHQQDGSVLNQRAPVPSGVAAGDAMVMSMSYNSTTATVADPAGWSRTNAVQSGSMTTVVWTRTADASDSGATVTVTSSAAVKSSLVIAAYRHATVLTGGSAAAVETITRAGHTTPVITAPAGSWLVSVWTDKTAATTAWTAPAGQRVLQTGAGTGAGHLSWLLTDSGGVVAGPVGGLTANADSASSSAAMVSIVLSPTG